MRYARTAIVVVFVLLAVGSALWVSRRSPGWGQDASMRDGLELRLQVPPVALHDAKVPFSATLTNHSGAPVSLSVSSWMVRSGSVGLGHPGRHWTRNVVVSLHSGESTTFAGYLPSGLAQERAEERAYGSMTTLNASSDLSARWGSKSIWLVTPFQGIRLQWTAP